ncbi:SurA N-terminal domain-containing protein [Aliidiomarina celeris]|uniref:SurA N-terminal domain-containing protein n=1 Tax=Aliidiomarina celeris TaxID=2249428 RepID=UPI000DE89D18|nr:SurA N-terminal domain-containing protein [Aliidiomarina celeris]
MLERIREGAQGPVVKFILGIIILAFALTGVNAYLGGNTDVYVAKVNGVEISRADFDRAYQSRRGQMEEQFGEMFEMLAADENYVRQLRNSVLEELIEDKLLIQFASSLGMQQSPEQLRDSIRSLEDFQIAGQFNVDLYNRALMNLGYTPAQFAQFMGEQNNRMALLQGTLLSEFVLPSEAERFQTLQNQRRSGRYVMVSGDQFVEQVELSEAEIEAWYYDNVERFEVEEQVQLQYVELSLDSIIAQTSVSDEQVREYYDRNPQAYSQAERRRIAHILVEFGDNEEAARERADAALARIRDGEAFTDVVADVSDDTFSEGGDLGYLERGAIDPDIEAAGFALTEQGEVSDVVRSEFGFHIIQLTEFTPEETVAFTEVADEIRTNLLRVEAENEYFRLQQELSRLSFEVPDTLNDVAQQLGLEVKTSPVISRANPPAGFDAPALLTQAFSADVTDRQLNSELVELDERSVVVRAESYEPARTRSLDEVRDVVVERLTSDKAQQLAVAEAERIAASLSAGEASGLSFEYIEGAARFGSELPGALRQELFRMAEGDVRSVALNNGSAAVVELTGITAGQVNAEQAERVNMQLQNTLIEQSYASLVEQLKAKATISRRL